jgi:hypothetical protein
MAKKIDIGSKEFSKRILHLRLQPNKNIIKSLDSKMFSLDANQVFNYKPEYLAGKEFESLCELVERRFPPDVTTKDISLKTIGLLGFISKQEMSHREELQELAINTIRELYNVPGHIRLRAFIEKKIDLDTSQDHNPNPFLNLSLEKKNSMRDEIQKRILLNSLVHGSSMYIWKSVYYIVRDRLNEINPMLVELYDEYTAGVNFSFWTFDPSTFQGAVNEGSQLTQGYNEIKFQEPGKAAATVVCKGINFPVLLHELNKGVIDYLICHGIPSEYSEEELRYYYSKSDNYQNEFWIYLLSPTLWADLLETVSLSPIELPGVIKKLSKLNYETLTEIFRMMMDDKTKAKIKLQTWNVI